MIHHLLPSPTLTQFMLWRSIRFIPATQPGTEYSERIALLTRVGDTAIGGPGA